MNGPLTGDEYVESIRDGREIYLYGDRVKDVTTHPAFRNPVRMTARMYDALHDPARREDLLRPGDEILTSRIEFGSGVLALRQLARRSGATLTVVGFRPDAPSTLTTWPGACRGG